MAFALAKKQLAFIKRMIRTGRYNSHSEVVRAALRRLEQHESDYLNPPVLTEAQIARIYGHRFDEEARERSFGKSAFAAIHRASRKRRQP